jgi:hypothetical protein
MKQDEDEACSRTRWIQFIRGVLIPKLFGEERDGEPPPP